MISKHEDRRRTGKTGSRARSARAAAAAVTAARRQLATARRQLAAATRAGDAHVFVEPSLRAKTSLLQRQAARLMAHPGVIGFGLGRRQVEGTETSEVCATVFVTRKLPAKELRKRGVAALPRTIGSGRNRLAVDVVQLGRFEHKAMLGSSTGPDDPEQRGTIGAFAGGVSDAGVYALTAMHVSEVDELGPGDPPVPFFVPSRVDDPTAPRFGLLVAGTRTGIDAGKIRLDRPAEATPFIRGIGPVKGWRPVVDPADRGTAVRMSGAASGVRHGRILTPNASMPDLSLDAAIVVDIDAQPGDSGAPIVDADGLVLGFLVGGGRGSTSNVFCPVGLVLSRLDCDIPTVP